MAIYREALAACAASDPFWQPRPCFRPPPEAVAREVAGRLTGAVDALLTGDRQAAIDGSRAAERPELLAWGVPIMSTIRPDIVRWRPIDGLPPSGRIDSGRVPKPVLDAMYRRDGWRCRFCGCPVVRPEARKRLGRLVPGAFRWTTRYGDHAGFFIMSGVADHVQPHSLGGPTDLGNLMTCCQPCNYGRGDACVAELGLIDPRSRDASPAEGWDGLERILARPMPPRPHGPVSDPPINRAVWSGFATLLKA